MNPQKNQTSLSLISKIEWWTNKVEVNTIRGTFNINLYLNYLKAIKHKTDENNKRN